MKRTSLLVALVVVGMFVVPAAGVAAQESGSDSGDEDDSGDVSPGERLSGVVGVQNAEINGEIERNAFRIALKRADDNATKAGHIAEKLNGTEHRLAELDERRAQLQQQRERGEMTEGQYRARTAMLASETETVKEQLNRSNATAAELPEETLRENGVNTTNIRTLMHSANELSGGDVSEIARGIAGDRSGMVDRGPGGERGPAGERGPGEDRGSGDRGPGDRGGVDDGDETADEQVGADDPDSGDDEETPDGTNGNETDDGDADGADSDATGSDATDSDDTGADDDSGSSGSDDDSGSSGSDGGSDSGSDGAAGPN